MKLEREELIELKIIIQRILKDVEEDIILYKPNAEDEDFNFLIKKAVSYRDTLLKIENELKEL